ncbi:MAG: riboflavin biosynthesis protein RibF [Bacteroidales bacterium]|nr:riboflavin biosynthesis protein RibF [Bacteroidales bacterium]
MEIVEGIDDYRSYEPACVTIGTFDGLHIGHRKILQSLVDIARREHLRSVVVTFDPHPRQVLMPDAEVRFVLTREEKIEMFSSLGIDVLVVHPFSKEFAAINAKDFLLQVLCCKLQMRHLVKGFNNHFGCDRLSDIDAIRALGVQNGFAVTQVDAEYCNGVAASSTLVRRLIMDGNMDDVAKVLSYQFFVEGTVVHGRMIGRTIGFPTANIDISDDSKILPRVGAYVAGVDVDGVYYPAILNIGSNPTVNSDRRKVFLEVHIIGFDADIYGRKLKVNILHRIRDEVAFGSIDELRAQLARDKEVALSIISQYAS